MTRTARRNTVVILAAIATPFAVGFFLRHTLDNFTPRQGVGYIVRCGGQYVVWMLSCAASASLASFIHAGTLFYTEYKRERGHALNGLTISQAAASLACGLAFSLPFWNLRNAPCWIAPAFYFAVAITIGARALHTMLRAPVLLQVPNFEIDRLIRAGEARLEQIQKTPGTTTLEEDKRFAPLLSEILENLRQINGNSTGSGEGAQ